jgi:hypothetical protein
MEKLVEQRSIISVVFDKEDLHVGCKIPRDLGSPSCSPTRGKFLVIA